jgi:hypothetical protein
VNNYLLYFFFCVSFTVFAALTGHDSLRWLVISDINVAIWLWVAWLFDWRR